MIYIYNTIDLKWRYQDVKTRPKTFETFFKSKSTDQGSNKTKNNDKAEKKKTDSNKKFSILMSVLVENYLI